MTVFVCVDEQGGILFNNRRVSSDRAVIADILEYAAERPVRMRACSAKLFPQDNALLVCDDYLEDARSGDLVFLEEAAPDELFKKAEKIVIFYWNRLYPSDIKFPVDQLRKLGKLESSAEFAGYSHDRITREVYVL